MLGALNRRGAVALLLILPLAECRPAAVPRPLMDEGAFAFLAGGDTTVVDEYIRTSTELRGNLRIFSRTPARASVGATYHVRYAASDLPDSALLTVTQVSPAGTAPLDDRRWTTDFREDGWVVEVDHHERRQFEASPGANALPLFGPSIAMLESIIQAARRRSLTRIPIFHLAAAGRVDTVDVRSPTPDLAELTIAGVTGRYRLDSRGRIMDGVFDQEALRAVRLR